MEFYEFCIKTRWWLLSIGTILLIYLSLFIGIIIITISIIGFFKNNSSNQINNYPLPIGFDYAKKFKVNNFIKCPVCKKNEIVTNKKNDKIKVCKNCNSKFKLTNKNFYQLYMDKTKNEYQNYKYNKCNLSIYEWNTISLTGNTLREKILNEISTGKMPNLSKSKIDSPIVLKSKEHFIWGEQSQLHEPRAVRNYNGTSFKIVKGVRIYNGQSESHQEMRHIDSGFLTLTNKRIVFSGGKRTANIDLKKIINITMYNNGIQVNVENRQKPQFFLTKDSEFWNALLTGNIYNNNNK